MGKIFAKEVELSDGITIMKVTRQRSGEEPCLKIGKLITTARKQWSSSRRL